MTLLQWNIWYKEDIRNVLKTLQEINADVLCLQELSVNRDEFNGGMDTGKYLAEHLGYEYVHGKGQGWLLSDGRERSVANGILSRYPIIGSDTRYIQESQPPESAVRGASKEGRVYVEATIEAEGRKVTVGTTHMSYTHALLETPAKKAETDKLTAILKDKKENFIFTGDLNAVPDSYTVTEILKHLKNAGPDLNEKSWTTKPFSYEGFEANTLDWRLDYCFATTDVKVRRAEMIKTPYSDHLPILIEF